MTFIKLCYIMELINNFMGSNPGGGLNRVTQCMNETEEIASCISHIVSVSLTN